MRANSITSPLRKTNKSCKFPTRSLSFEDRKSGNVRTERLEGSLDLRVSAFLSTLISLGEKKAETLRELKMPLWRFSMARLDC
jgi:hypothetical protein